MSDKLPKYTRVIVEGEEQFILREAQFDPRKAKRLLSQFGSGLFGYAEDVKGALGEQDPAYAAELIEDVIYDLQDLAADMEELHDEARAAMDDDPEAF